MGASLLVVYLPIALIKDWLCNLLKKRKNSRLPDTVQISSGLDSPLKFGGMQKILEMGMQSQLTMKDSSIDLSLHEEEKPFIAEFQDESNVADLKENKELNTREIAIYSFYLAPIWFITEVTFYSTIDIPFF